MPHSTDTCLPAVLLKRVLPAAVLQHLSAYLRREGGPATGLKGRRVVVGQLPDGVI